MVIDWSTVKAVTIPEGECKRIAVDGIVVWERGGLPSAYQQVEYIENDGSAYIATSYTPTVTQSIKIECDYAFTATQSGDRFLFGSRDGATFQCEFFNHGAWYCGSGIYQFRNILGGIGSILNTRYSLVMDENTLTVDGRTANNTETRSGNALPIYIFAGNWHGVTKYINTGARIYKLTFTVDGTVEADFIPCYRIADGVIGMYDLVSNTFFTNSGSGTFTKGADV